MSLEDYIRFHLAKNEQMADFSIATETVRALIDVYNSKEDKSLLPEYEERYKKILNSHISDGKKVIMYIDEAMNRHIVTNGISPTFILINEKDFEKMKIYASEVLSINYSKDGRFHYKSALLVRTKDIAEKTVFAVR